MLGQWLQQVNAHQEFNLLSQLHDFGLDLPDVLHLMPVQTVESQVSRGFQPGVHHVHGSQDVQPAHRVLERDHSRVLALASVAGLISSRHFEFQIVVAVPRVVEGALIVESTFRHVSEDVGLHEALKMEVRLLFYEVLKDYF